MRLPVIIVAVLGVVACNSRTVTLVDGATAADTELATDSSVADGVVVSDASPYCSINSDCGPSAYCHIDSGCIASGAKMGECKPRPENCYTVVDPVCGCDGKSYSNACQAHAAGVNVANKGSCQPMVTVLTDKATYGPSDPVKITLTNGMTQSIFLGGCGIYSWERKEAGVWVTKGPTIMCGWEGNAVEVPAGKILVETDSNQGGLWRLRLDYGVGCTPKAPLSSCAPLLYAYSNVFTIQASPKDCAAVEKTYLAAVSAARSCSAADPVLHCQHLVLESLSCGCKTYVESDTKLKLIHQSYLSLGCDQLPPPSCPPYACPPLKGSTCAGGTCTDLTF